MFHFIDPQLYEELPRDALDAAADALYAVSALVSTADDEIVNGRTIRGLHLITAAIVNVVDDTAAMVDRMVSEPFAAGYRKGMLFADDQYFRGVSEGTKRARDELLSNIEESHPNAAAEYRRRMGSAPVPDDAPDSETSGEASEGAATYPRVDPEKETKHPPADAAGAEKGARKRRRNGTDD